MSFVSSLRTIREPERELASPTTGELRGPRILAALALVLLIPEPGFVVEVEPDEHGDCEVTLRGAAI